MQIGKGYRQYGLAAISISLVLLYLRSEHHIGPASVPYRYNVPPVKEGDLIFRYGQGRWSGYFRDISKTEKRFSHVGIVVADSMGLAVVHASADDLTGIGSVKMETLESFSGNFDDVAVYRIDCDQDRKRKISELALAYLGTPFDARFDLSSDKAVYCTELVRIVVNGALDREVIGTTVKLGLEFVAIDNCYLGPWATLVYDRRPNAVPVD